MTLAWMCPWNHNRAARGSITVPPCFGSIIVPKRHIYASGDTSFWGSATE